MNVTYIHACVKVYYIPLLISILGKYALYQMGFV